MLVLIIKLVLYLFELFCTKSYEMLLTDWMKVVYRFYHSQNFKWKALQKLLWKTFEIFLEIVSKPESKSLLVYKRWNITLTLYLTLFFARTWATFTYKLIYIELFSFSFVEFSFCIFISFKLIETACFKINRHICWYNLGWILLSINFSFLFSLWNLNSWLIT